MKLEIKNRTDWQTRHIRAFVREAMRRERPSFKGTMRVYVKYNRQRDSGSCSGHAPIGGYWFRAMLPSQVVDKIDLAQMLVHEIGHTAGLQHDVMEGCPVYRRVGNWRELYSWAETLPLEKAVRLPKRKPVTDKLAHAERMLKAAMTREKRATTLRKKWQARVKRYQRVVQLPRPSHAEPNVELAARQAAPERTS